MQDLSEKVQKIASDFYRTRSNNAFTAFYQTLLPEANKMLRGFVKDMQTIEDISSKIFETILVKPSIFFDTGTQDQFLQIAASYFGVGKEECKHYYYHVQPSLTPIGEEEHGTNSEGDLEPAGKIKSYYATIYDKDERATRCIKNSGGGIGYSTMGKLWLLIHNSRNYKVYYKDDCGNRTNKEVKLTLATISDFDLSQLSDAPAPFVFNLDKPFLHYFSRIVKTNALSHIKKSKKYHDQQFSDMYAGFDDDDRPQLIANQLSDEGERVEKMNTEHNELLEKQKFMIIFDIIQNTVPEHHRGIMIDAILNKMDYKQIASKWNLDTVGCIKSRVHRFKKRLDEEIAKTPHFTSQVNLGVYTTYYSGGRVRMMVDVCEPLGEDGVIHSLWHGHYISYYSTGEVKEIGRYYLNKKQGDWYTFHKDGRIAKRGAYQQDKPEGVWHHFDNDGKLNSKINHLTGYYEVYQENGEVVSGVKDSPLLPVKERKPSQDEILASKLCLKYDSELAYPSLHFEI